jgi:glycosyltransferase involved in cell wall biosynthesis
MAAGKPIVALVSESSEVAKVVREERIGWVVEPGAIEKTVEAIQAARNNRELLVEMGARGRRAAETKYSSGAILRQFDVFLEAPGESPGSGCMPPSVVSPKLPQS